jgi:hypothetical protein
MDPWLSYQVGDGQDILGPLNFQHPFAGRDVEIVVDLGPIL